MHVVVDEAVWGASELFGQFGRVTVLPAREIVAARLKGAEALVVRSGVRVGRELVEGTEVRFIGTATAGVDHVDEAWLRGAGVEFASAPGCNARAVGEYVVAALLAIGERLGLDWVGRTLGVVGVGHVGKIVAELGAALGIRVLSCDPPRARAEGAGGFVGLEDLLSEADVVSLHVPLTRAGPDATLRMIDARRLARMRSEAVLINASRGEVVDTAAMMAARRAGRLAGLVCDVWDLEPRIDEALMDVADIMTPHIAGYSLEGKVAGTRMVIEALGRFAGVAAEVKWPMLGGGEHGVEGLEIRLEGRSGRLPTLNDCVKMAYDVFADSAAFREVVRRDGRGADVLAKVRKEYPLRREFASYLVDVASRASAEARGLLGYLRRIGFGVRNVPENSEDGDRQP